MRLPNACCFRGIVLPRLDLHPDHLPVNGKKWSVIGNSIQTRGGGNVAELGIISKGLKSEVASKRIGPNGCILP